jgi:hypothetical protein
METVTNDMYNPHSLVTLKKIINTESGDVQFELYKVTELESVLDEMTRRNNLISQRIEAQEKQIGQIIDNLTAQGWYNPNYEKSEVLSDLCDILGHEPKQEIRITATVQVEVVYDCPLDEVEDFDARYFLQDVLTVDAYNGDVIVESFDVEDADVNW